MKIYCVGGAVRDELLGLPVQDRDYVVVGATPEQLIAQGFVPVGKDFPVFLHPRTHDEYALARTERKTGPGYKGFAVHFDPGVRLEDDLLRRDLTINAMARGEDGALVDPHGGEADLRARVLRHVSEAFVEDPVRVLRLARFAARFADFSVAPATMALMQHMAAAGELEALVAERVWQEMARGLMEARPSRMFEVLQQAHALPILSQSLAQAWQQPALARQLDASAARGQALAQRFAVLTHDLGENLEVFSQAWRVPGECRDLGLLLARERAALMAATHLEAGQLVGLYERCDARRKPERFVALIDAAQVIEAFDDQALHRMLAALETLDEAAIARTQSHPSQIRAAIHEARVRRVRDLPPS